MIYGFAESCHVQICTPGFLPERFRCCKCARPGRSNIQQSGDTIGDLPRDARDKDSPFTVMIQRGDIFTVLIGHGCNRLPLRKIHAAVRRPQRDITGLASSDVKRLIDHAD